MGKIAIYADGGCSGNPGPGAWAAVIIKSDGEIVISGGEKNTTNNRMELTAVINGLRETKHGADHAGGLDVYTDSQYVKKGITEWIHTWIKNGWKNSARNPVKNQDLWKSLRSLTEGLTVAWHWIKGHADNPHNNRCDALVQKEIKKLKC